MTTTPDPRALVSKVDAVITSAAGVLAGVWQATQAGTPLAGDRMLGDLAGRVMGAVTGVPPVGGMPGLGLRGGGMSFDRETFLRSFAKDPAGTETQVAATAVRLSSVATAASDPAAGYLAVRLAAAQNLRQGYSAPKAAPEERLTGRTLELKRRESSLESLLGHLHGQGDWLRSELAGTAAGTTSPAGAWLPPVEPVPADRRQPA
ncbi:MAG: hypothetical protein IPI32_10115 [Austwickia sp.]|nr:hypothetical protein [Austwickia sp.]